MSRIQRKGEGARYGRKIERLSDTHVRILKILLTEGPLTKQEITRIFNKEQESMKEPYIGGFSISGRLSELCGANLLSMKYEEVKLLNPKTMQFRFVKKPLWRLTDQGTKQAWFGGVELLYRPENEKL